MRILVAVKRVVDYAVKVRVKPDKTGIETQNVKMSMNPFCEIALEEAVRDSVTHACSIVGQAIDYEPFLFQVRIKTKGLAQEIVAVTLGPKPVRSVLTSACVCSPHNPVYLLLVCSVPRVAANSNGDWRRPRYPRQHRHEHRSGEQHDVIVSFAYSLFSRHHHRSLFVILCPSQDLQPLAVAKLLQKVVDKEKPSLVLMGKQAIDGDNNQTPQMLAGTCVRLEMHSDAHTACWLCDYDRRFENREFMSTLLCRSPALSQGC